MQDSKSWLEWRAKGLGGSDVPALFGLCSYKSYAQTMIEKVNWENYLERKSTYISELGHKWEKIIRDKIYLETFIDYQPALFVDEKEPYLRVSLDGHSPENKNFIEVKMTGKAKYESLLKKEVPKNFLYQVQYQLAVTGYEEAIIWAVRYDRDPKEIGKDITSVIVKPDKFLQEKILLKVRDVWSKIIVQRESKSKSPS